MSQSQNAKIEARCRQIQRERKLRSTISKTERLAITEEEHLHGHSDELRNREPMGREENAI